MRAYDEELVFVYKEDYKTFHEEGEQELFVYRVTLGVLMCVGLMMLVVFTVIIRKGSRKQVPNFFPNKMYYIVINPNQGGTNKNLYMGTRIEILCTIILSA